MMSVIPVAAWPGNDQAGAGPLWREAGKLERGICSFYYYCRPECVVDGAAPSMLTHRETAVMASLSRGVRLGR